MLEVPSRCATARKRILKTKASGINGAEKQDGEVALFYL